MSYKESKMMLNKIRDDYGCKGEIIFKSALQCVVQYGADNLVDDWNYAHILDDINDRHNAAESKGTILVITRAFEIEILACAREIAKVPVMDVLRYVQKEVWLSGDGIDYQRVLELLQSCLEWFADDTLNDRIVDNLYLLGFRDYEIEELGYGWLFEEEDEDE